ncbi:hypothetical protein KSP39_PZI019309 [Platanthera zijinensis]|uniref:S-acyltransferase n=1 Tax=Platanthera zijinensis TaxID=2320716 RepID=A0AAP0FY56_9ASPA
MAALIWAAKPWWLRLRSMLVSFVIVLLSHIALVMVPRLFPSLSLSAMLPIAGFLMYSTYALAGWLRRILGIPASAPAMVTGHVLFLWAVHITVIREVIPNLLDASLNMECLLLLFGVYRFVSGDPGLVSIESTSSGPLVFPEPIGIELSCSQALAQTDSSTVDLPNTSSLHILRVRCCYCCKRSVKGFDHHCPAFGNCIGQKNHQLFMVLIMFFIITEGTYTICSNQFIKVSSGAHEVKFERIFSGDLVISTLLFSSLQVLWQVPFLSWHIYCICYNIKTEEWVNWQKYPEFQVTEPQKDSRFTVTRFVNPYNMGILSNIKEYLRPKFSC